MKDFDIVEIIMIIFPIALLITTICIVIQQENKTCLEYQEIPVTNCYRAGGGFTCEQINDKRCIRYK